MPNLKLPIVTVLEIWIGSVSDLFGSCDLDLDPMTFICELDPYCREIHRVCKYEHATSSLSKVIV